MLKASLVFPRRAVLLRARVQAFTAENHKLREEARRFKQAVRTFRHLPSSHVVITPIPFLVTGISHDCSGSECGSVIPPLRAYFGEINAHWVSSFMFRVPLLTISHFIVLTSHQLPLCPSRSFGAGLTDFAAVEMKRARNLSGLLEMSAGKHSIISSFLYYICKSS